MNALAAIGGFFLLSSSDRAQNQTHPLEFDVATVKVNKDGRGGSIIRTPGRLTATNTELSKLLEMAFQTRSLDLSAVPESLRSERFDIGAKASGKVVGDQYWDMLRSFLEQRFELKYHSQNKNTQLYALMPAKSGTSLGPKISRSQDADCPVEPTVSNFCGVSAQPGRVIGERVTMARIALELSGFADRPVQDQTGLSGSFDFQLTWTPGRVCISRGPKETSERNRARYFGTFPLFGGSGATRSEIAGDRGQIEVIVIDHAEQPRQN